MSRPAGDQAAAPVEGVVHPLLPAGGAPVSAAAARASTSNDGTRKSVGDIVGGACWRCKAQKAFAKASERIQAAAVAADGEKVLGRGGDQKSEKAASNRNLRIDQGQKASAAGIGKRTQEKLDALARKAPDLLDKVRSGQMSAHRGGAGEYEAGRQSAQSGCGNFHSLHLPVRRCPVRRRSPPAPARRDPRLGPARQPREGQADRQGRTGRGWTRSRHAD